MSAAYYFQVLYKAGQEEDQWTVAEGDPFMYMYMMTLQPVKFICRNTIVDTDM